STSCLTQGAVEVVSKILSGGLVTMRNSSSLNSYSVIALFTLSCVVISVMSTSTSATFADWHLNLPNKCADSCIALTIEKNSCVLPASRGPNTTLTLLGAQM